MPAITAILTNSSGSLTLPPLEQDFINQNLENAVDVVTLDNAIYTDFIDSDFAQWSLQWESMTQAEYDAIRAFYDAQFTEFAYPTLDITFYDIEDVPVRMTINEKNIWNYCGDVMGVQITLRETNTLPEVS